METLFFALAFIANVLSGQTGTQPELQANATTMIKCELGLLNTATGNLVDMQLVWGPVVYQAPGSNVADNVMYVVKNNKSLTPNDYTVAIAGTNFKSPFDWVIEDGLVKYTSLWNRRNHNAGRIALGTRLGLEILQTLPSVPAGSTQALTLQEFLARQIGDSTATVHVTGHSLGGALAPVVGLWLQEQKPYWGANATVSVIAFAGPTPGDARFADYYLTKLGAANATRVWNQYDVVPHAWAQATSPGFSEIPGLYQGLPAPGTVPPSKDIKDIVTLLEKISSKTDYAQPDDNDAGFTDGKYADVTTCDSDFGKFVVQAVYQHINAYKVHYGLPTTGTTNPCGAQGVPLTCATVNALAKELRAKIQKELASLK